MKDLQQAKQFIDSYDLSEVIDRLVIVEKWKEKHAIAACQQYRNFLYLKMKYGHQYELPPSYDMDEAWHAHILHTEDFNPNSKEYVTYLQQADPEGLCTHLIKLCYAFYDRQSSDKSMDRIYNYNKEEVNVQQEKVIFYQCNNCLTRYGKAYGDCENKIEKGVDFDKLINYTCPVCEAPKEDFSLVETKNQNV